MFGLGHLELVVVGIVAILLFGRKLPEVARSLGSSYRQFKQGLSDLQSQVDFTDTYTPPPSRSKSYSSSSAPVASSGSSYDDEEYYDETTVPKFEPPKEESP